jgi:peptidyl-dipeptidase A
MEVLTGQRNMDATGLLDYFSPLADWLQRDNRESGEHIGWEPSRKRKHINNISKFTSHLVENTRSVF